MDNDQLKLLHRGNRMMKEVRRSQGEHVHKVKKKYDRKRSKKEFLEQLKEERCYEC